MPQHILHADFIFDGQRLYRDHSLVFEEDGRVKGLTPGNLLSATHYEGIISPSFVNAHCHLELSHLHGKIPRGTGMAGFIETLQGIRNDFSDAERMAAAEQALAAMWASGTAGLGDICNGTHSIAAKVAHPEMHFRNFCELFGLAPQKAEALMEKGLDLAAQFPGKAHPTLHAPYSISPRLRDLIIQHLRDRLLPLSLHFLESSQERELFEELSGELLDLFRKWNLTFSPYTYGSVLDYLLEALPQDIPVLLVHNVELRPDEFEKIVTGWSNVFFTLCPRANQYIHERLPDAKMFAAYPDRVCLGTDSLAGNDSLDLLAEMQLLQEAQGISTETLLRWATTNGARALQLPQERFAIVAGSRPILTQVAGVEGENAKFTSESRSRRIHLS